MTAQIPTQTVIVPDGKMGTEPAETIANLTKIKNAIAMIVAVAGVAIAPELSESLDVLIQSGVAVAYGVWAIYQAHRQGRSTRAVVYSPASAAKLAKVDPDAVEIVEFKVGR